ncbi:hypothetical protein [Labrys sp. ZIDIC5]|uniref:hypothetical protein n=1 Tax=Labrys sedimenti TaxID=3106036 RepID=UPI002ACA41E0|nr:hypothetical protein [Labrys sp. ZIDIC5]MDZ5448603.1 hypothetical protein [Labrys sp. ZIDIC5]
MAGAGTMTMACIAVGGAVAMKAGVGMADGTGMTAGAGMVAGITVGDRLRAANIANQDTRQKSPTLLAPGEFYWGTIVSRPLLMSWPLTDASVSTACDFGVIPKARCGGSSVTRFYRTVL